MTAFFYCWAVFATALVCCGLTTADLASHFVSSAALRRHIVSRILMDDRHMYRPEPVNEDGTLDPSGPLTVKVDLALRDIVSVDKNTNEVELVIWPTFFWRTNFGWSTQFQGDSYNVSSVTLPADRIWKPDILVYSLSAPVQNLYKNVNVVLLQNGEAIYVPPQRISIMCDVANVNLNNGATCEIKLGSWVLNGNELDLQAMNKDGISQEYSFLGSKYKVLASNVTKNVLHYSCCTEPYVDLTYSITIRSKD